MPAFNCLAATSLNLEYAREWKAGGLDRAERTEDDLVFVQLSRRTNVFSLDAIYADIGEYFNPETGFVPRVDRRGVVIRSRYNKQYKGTLERLRGEVEYERLTNHAGELMNHRAVLVDSSALKTFFSSLDLNGIITLTMTTLNYMRTGLLVSSSGGFHRNMCKSETPGLRST